MTIQDSSLLSRFIDLHGPTCQGWNKQNVGTNSNIYKGVFGCCPGRPYQIVGEPKIWRSIQPPAP